MTNLELADTLQKEAEHFAGAQDLVGMLWDAGAALRNLHTENMALRVTEDNLRQELEALKRAISEAEPVGTAISYYSEGGHTKWTFQPDKSAWEIPQDAKADERGARSCFEVYTLKGIK